MLISSFNNVRPFRSFHQGLVFFLSLLTLMTAAQVPSTPDKSSVHLVPGSDTAMNAAAQWYQKETIFLVGGNTYVKNGKSFTGRKMLVKEFLISPSGMNLYVRSRRIRNFTLTLSLASAVGTIFTTTSNNRDNLRGLMWTSIGVGIVSSWGNAYANSVRDRAFWVRNHDAMLKMNEMD
ncbi:hypothetical protein [Dyadobacter fermentans]|uniref:hypothetical protein n=1 Tax=Dyadobacter fermentans TaxID=94254 RepID=UPI001CBC2928|nr:hypothetical protein [Dyadobacter fermentans]MBZ1359229.1 hypothetical protein [Dyadobacter fermentans]